MPSDCAPPAPLSVLRPSALRQAAAPVDWLWAGYLAPGNITLLTGPWKAGKTTLASALLTRLEGGGRLAGLPIRPGKAVVVSEEAPQQWSRRCEKFRIQDQLCFVCRPFRGKPTPAGWLAFLEQLAQLHADCPIDLLVLDPLASFLPGRAENDAALMLEALAPLHRLTQSGMAVLLLHHPRKHPSPAGQWSRGSGLLLSHVDIVIEMFYFSDAAAPDRRRTLHGYSRFEETPRQLVIELNEAGTDFTAHGDLEEVEFADRWQVIHRVLSVARDKLTAAEIAADLPPAEIPSEATLWRWLSRAVEQGLLAREGKGVKHHPYRYWLREREEQWRQDPEGLKAAQQELDQWLRSLGDSDQPKQDPRPDKP